MKKYYRLMLGSAGEHLDECLAGSFIGLDYGIREDLTSRLTENLRGFNRQFVPIYLSGRPNKTRIAAGSAGGKIWTFAKVVVQGDIFLCPDNNRNYHVCEVIGEYEYHPEGVLPHRRSVKWLNQTIPITDMKPPLQSSTTAPGALRNITNHTEEIEGLLSGFVGADISPNDATIENLSQFAMEKHLEEFLVHNWSHTQFANEYQIYSDEGEKVGQQYRTEGNEAIDILAVSKDNQTLLVIELKKGRASDVVVGQILRYMGYVKEELAEPGQNVKGIIIAMEDDQRIRRALSVVSNIEFYRYQVSFKLHKVM